MYSPREAKQIGKFISLVLRHQPALIGIHPDPQGWVPVTDLLAGLARKGRSVSKAQLDYLVANNPKQRYAYNETQTHIRAQQGHSIAVDLEYEPVVPPEFLYHGTATKNLSGIRGKGLLKGSRHHVHLSLDKDTASMVGMRHGELVILIVAAQRMQEAGYEFFHTPNQVWLTDHVPVEYLQFPS